MSQLLLRLFPQWDCKGGGGYLFVFPTQGYERVKLSIHPSVQAAKTDLAALQNFVSNPK